MTRHFFWWKRARGGFLYISQLQPFVRVKMSVEQIIETLLIDRRTITYDSSQLLRVPRRENVISCRPLYLLISFKNGCWEWKRARHPDGYGNICVNYRTLPAHKFFYMLFVGHVPSGLKCCHHCDNPPCVNPDHIFVGTDADNTRDKMAKGRHRLNGGGGFGSYKLTRETIVSIRNNPPISIEERKKLAATLGVHPDTIRRIAKVDSLKHVPI